MLPGTAATGTVDVVAMGTKPTPLVELEADFVEGQEDEEEKEEVGEEVGGQE